MKPQLLARGTSCGLFLISVLTLLSCGPQITVKVDYDDKTNFAALRSFGFKDSTEPSKTEQVVKQAVQSELLAKGYSLRTENEPADFQVACHAATQKKTIWQHEYSPTGVPTGIVPITFDEGTIAIQIIDPKTGKVIWTGQAEEALDDQSQTVDEIKPEVSKLLARFPPR